MKTNYSLDVLCKKLSRIGPYWREIIHRYKNHKMYNPNNEFEFFQYMEQFRQLHLVVSLEKIAEDFPKLDIETKVPPIDKDETEYFLFRHDDAGRLLVYGTHRLNRERHYKYEKLITVDNDPVIFEVRLGIGIYNLLKPDVYEPKLAPIRHFYGRDVGYVLIISRGTFYHIRNSESFLDFLKEGGKVVPLYADRNQFNQDVLNFIKKAGLKLKGEEPKLYN